MNEESKCIQNQQHTANDQFFYLTLEKTCTIIARKRLPAYDW